MEVGVKSRNFELPELGGTRVPHTQREAIGLENFSTEGLTEMRHSQGLYP